MQIKSTVVIHAYNPNTTEVEEASSVVQGQPGLPSKKDPISNKHKSNNNNKKHHNEISPYAFLND
jgi:hypothetical protein